MPPQRRPLLVALILVVSRCPEEVSMIVIVADSPAVAH